MKNEYLRAIESFAFRAFLIAIGFQMFTLSMLAFGSNEIATVHGSIIGIKESNSNMIGNYSYSSLLVCSKLLGFYCLESLGQSFDFRKFSEITDWKRKTMRAN